MASGSFRNLGLFSFPIYWTPGPSVYDSGSALWSVRSLQWYKYPASFTPGPHLDLLVFTGLDSYSYGVSAIQPFPSDMSNLLEFPHLATVSGFTDYGFSIENTKLNNTIQSMLQPAPLMLTSSDAHNLGLAISPDYPHKSYAVYIYNGYIKRLYESGPIQFTTFKSNFGNHGSQSTCSIDYSQKTWII
ncbi:hypothetical protein BDW22DRAFT_1346130 [Trametopsis cervina]|nr:hypothetical protein BDW22DRAFT_1346130 [Trametopsis cervina]